MSFDPLRPPRHELIRQGRELGLIQMSPTGAWVLSKEGRDFLDLIELLRSLDDRPRSRGASSPRRQAQQPRSSGSGAAPGGPQRGDDVPPGRRGRARKDTGG